MVKTSARPGLIDPEAAADYLAKPVGWLHDNWKRLGMPAIRVGKQLRFRLEELDAWCEAHREIG